MFGSKNGTYEEIVFFRNKSNLSFRAEDREKVQVGYANNSASSAIPSPNSSPCRRDAETIANYSNPSFVLDGWMPNVEK